MSKSLELMNAFYENNQEALKAEDYELAQLWSQCESMVNNLYHGKEPSVWIPQLKSIIEDWIVEEPNFELVKAYKEALEFIAIVE